jgi:hypothetical protein
MFNGGFPPLKKKTNKGKKLERHYSPKIANVDIKHILSSNTVKPMIELTKNEVDIIDNF